MAEKITGRPRNYTDDQVLEGIEIVEQNGEQPTGDSVKKAMCAHLGVPDGISALCLEKEVQRLVEDRDRQRQQTLIAALPGGSRAAVKEIGAMVETAVLLQIGQEFEGLRAMAAQKVAAQEVDLGSQRAQIRDLLSKVDHMAAEIADLEHAKLEVDKLLAKANSENAALKAQIEVVQQEQDFRAQMLALSRRLCISLWRQSSRCGSPLH